MNCTHCDTPLPTNSRFCLSCGADLSDPGGAPKTTTSTRDLIGRLGRALEGRYRVTKMLGRGGMGAVFLAEDQTLERPVAIKVLPPDVSHDESLVGRFEREARTAAKLDHPNIIPIFSVESAEDLHYFVMKYVSGQPLDDVLKGGTLPTDLVQQYLWEAAVALGHAHRRGVVHRDIKPANIMLDHDGRIMLADFGISKAMQAATQLTGTGQVIGTPHYMSPEQARGDDVDGRSDQYSLAVVGYQMVAGRLPFDDVHVHALIFKHISEDPPPLRDLNPDVPPFLATAIHRALAKKPADRFASMEDFATAVCPDRRLSLPTASAADPGSQRVSEASEAPTEIAATSDVTHAPSRSRRSSGWIAAIVVFGVLAGGGGWAWSRGMLDDALGLSTGANRAAPGTGLTAGAALASTPGENVALPEDTSTTEKPEPEPEPVDPPVSSSPPPSTPTQPVRQPERSPVRQPPVAVAPRVGFLTVDATPWGTVFIDDVEIRETPLVRHEIPAGRHIVRISQTNCQDYVDTVTVAAGGNPRIRAVLTCGGSS